jgi:hypothetical protein
MKLTILALLISVNFSTSATEMSAMVVFDVNSYKELTLKNIITNTNEYELSSGDTAINWHEVVEATTMKKFPSLKANDSSLDKFLKVTDTLYLKDGGMVRLDDIYNRNTGGIIDYDMLSRLNDTLMATGPGLGGGSLLLQK